MIIRPVEPVLGSHPCGILEKRAFFTGGYMDPLLAYVECHWRRIILMYTRLNQFCARVFELDGGPTLTSVGSTFRVWEFPEILPPNKDGCSPWNLMPARFYSPSTGLDKPKNYT